MHCKVCSAPIPAIDSTGQYRCSYCDTLANIRKTTIDRIAMTTATVDAMCPICVLPLRHGSIDKAAILACEGCHGFLISHDAFGTVVAQRRKNYRGAEVLPGRLDQKKLARRLACPHCDSTMGAHAYFGPGNAVLTTCRDCHVIWLDAGDVTSIEQAPGVRQAVEHVSGWPQ